MRKPVLNTPIRYPGGKSKAVKKLYEYMPLMNKYTEWREPFLGGGSMSIEMSKRSVSYTHLTLPTTPYV